MEKLMKIVRLLDCWIVRLNPLSSSPRLQHSLVVTTPFSLLLFLALSGGFSGGRKTLNKGQRECTHWTV